MNMILLFIEVLFSSATVMFLFKKYKYEGINLIILIFSMLVGLASQKMVEILELKINLGFILTILIIISSNIIVQKKGPEEIKNTLSMIIFGGITIYIFSLITTLITASDINEISNYSFDKLFYLNKRTFFASYISIGSSIILNSILYHQIRQIKNKIWISNMLSTIIICIIESTLFCVISYSFKIPALNVIELIVIRYIFTTIIGLLGTTIIYIANKIER